MVSDQAVRVKEDVDDTLDRCGAVVMGEDHPDTVFPGLGNDTLCAVFRILLYIPPKGIHFKDRIEPDGLGLLQDVKDIIQERARTLFVENQTKSLKSF